MSVLQGFMDYSPTSVGIALVQSGGGRVVMARGDRCRKIDNAPRVFYLSGSI